MAILFSFALVAILACKANAETSAHWTNTSTASTTLNTPQGIVAHPIVTAPAILHPTSVAFDCPVNCSFWSLKYLSSTWSQTQNPILYGTVFIVVDERTNRTTTSTKLLLNATQTVGNSTMEILTPASTTKTQIVTGKFDGELTPVIYPTAFAEFDPVISWNGTVAYTSDGLPYCTDRIVPVATTEPGASPSPLPARPYWPVSTSMPDPNDPYGQTYELDKAVSNPDPVGINRFNISELESAYPDDQVMKYIYVSCTPRLVASPTLTFATSVTPSAVSKRDVLLLVTETATISSPARVPTEPVSPGSSQSAIDPFATEPIVPPSAPEPPAAQPADPLSTPKAITPVAVPQQPPSQPVPAAPSCTNLACLIIAGIGGSTSTPVPLANEPAPSAGSGSNSVANPAAGNSGSGSGVLSGGSSAGTAGDGNDASGSGAGSGSSESGGDVSSGSSSGNSGTGGSLSNSQGAGADGAAGSGAGSGTPASGGAGAEGGDDTAASAAVFNIGGSTVTANADSGIVIGGSTIAPGGPAVVVGGSTISLAPSATAVVVNGATVPQVASPAGATPAPVISVGDTAVTANSAGDFVIGSQTLSAGGTGIVVSGTSVSLLPGGSSVVVNGATSAVAPGPTAPPQPSITVAGQVITANDQSQYVYGSQTLSEGGQIVVSGTTYSMGPSGTVIIADASTTRTVAQTATAAGPQTSVAVQTTNAGARSELPKMWYSLAITCLIFVAF